MNEKMAVCLNRSCTNYSQQVPIKYGTSVVCGHCEKRANIVLLSTDWRPPRGPDGLVPPYDHQQETDGSLH